MAIIKLTVQSTGNGKFRLGINTFDSKEHFKIRGRVVYVFFPRKKEIKTKTTCGLPSWLQAEKEKGRRKKGYDLYDKEIHIWLSEKEFFNPTKLLFEMQKKRRGIELYFIKRIDK
jgi:hypothetical protein